MEIHFFIPNTLIIGIASVMVGFLIGRVSVIRTRPIARVHQTPIHVPVENRRRRRSE